MVMMFSSKIYKDHSMNSTESVIYKKLLMLFYLFFGACEEISPSSETIGNVTDQFFETPLRNHQDKAMEQPCQVNERLDLCEICGEGGISVKPDHDPNCSDEPFCTSLQKYYLQQEPSGQFSCYQRHYIAGPGTCAQVGVCSSETLEDQCTEVEPELIIDSQQLGICDRIADCQGNRGPVIINNVGASCGSGALVCNSLGNCVDATSYHCESLLENIGGVIRDSMQICNDELINEALCDVYLPGILSCKTLCEDGFRGSCQQAWNTLNQNRCRQADEVSCDEVINNVICRCNSYLE